MLINSNKKMLKPDKTIMQTIKILYLFCYSLIELFLVGQNYSDMVVLFGIIFFKYL